ncbi:glycoside hydrolase family 16 protein [Pseudonocardia lacus]|uniref:glycoside hydrolase family 16 protein n=1 Tax=Pseudonocardia lacus TaxID=2835865 RepID=UPI001BDD8ABE|nr:glycoside hydrolase family 16 protein [Pseudonocardia lacus]
MTAPPAPPAPPPPAPRRPAVLVAGLLSAALVATLVIVAVRTATGQDAAARTSAGADTSAGVLQAWGEPTVTEEFDGPLGEQWRLYDGPGHVGNGIRSPGAVGVDDGLLTITGDAEGTTGGMALFPGQMYGRWEARVRAPAGDETYHALLLLWPDAEDWPVGGEVDFMEMLDPTRQKTKIFIHYGEDNSQVQGEVFTDGTQWHNWAVEWSPEHIIAYLDGREWYRTSDPEVLPPGPMHLAIQLDWFPGKDEDGDVRESQMQVDWVKVYPF